MYIYTVYKVDYTKYSVYLILYKHLRDNHLLKVNQLKYYKLTISNRPSTALANLKMPIK